MKRNKFLRRHGLRLGLLLTCSVAIYAHYLITTKQHIVPACWLFIAGLIGAALFLKSGGAATAVGGDRPRWQVIKRRRLIVRIIAVVCVAAGGTLLFHTSRMMHIKWHEYYFSSLYRYGLSFLLLAFGLDHMGSRVIRRVRHTRSSVKGEIIIFLAILAVGIFMRSCQLDYYPPPDGIPCCEEGQQGTRAYQMLFRGARHWEFYLSNLVTALSFSQLGVSMISLRIPPVVLASLTLIPFYFMIRLLVGYRVALVSTFLFAVSRWHLCYARLAHNVFIPVFFVMLMIALLVRSRYSWRPSLYVWIGAFSGFLLFSYAGYRATILFALGFLIAHAILQRMKRGKLAGEENKYIRAKPLVGCVVVICIAAAIALPFFQRIPSMKIYFEAAKRTMRPHRGYYGEDSVTEFVENRWDRLKRTMGLFTYRGDWSAAMNLPDEPMLDPVTGFCFFLGLAYAIVLFRKRMHLFFLTVFVLSLFLSAIFVHNLDVRRLISIIPLVYLFVAFGIAAVESFVKKRAGRSTYLTFMTVLLAASLFAAWYNYERFFNRQIISNRVRVTYKNPYTIVVDHVKDFPEGSYVVLVTPVIHNMFTSNDLAWLRGDHVRGKCVKSFDEIFPLPDAPQQYVIFQAPLDIRSLADRLLQRIPTARCSFHTDPDRKDLRIAICTLPSTNVPEGKQVR